jgi:hypothetical protein
MRNRHTAAEGGNDAEKTPATPKTWPRDRFHGLPGSWKRDPVTGQRTPADEHARRALEDLERSEAQQKALYAKASSNPPAEGQ